MNRIVAVAVDLAVRAVDRPFHYLWPSSLGPVVPGQMVEVPFANRRAMALVLREVSPEEAEGRKLLPVSSRLPGRPVPEHLLPLAEWVSSRYLALFSQSVRLLTPPGARSGQAARSEVLCAVGEVAAAREAVAALEGRAPRQAQILRHLLEAGEERQPDLVRIFGRSALVALQEKGLVVTRSQRRWRRPLQGRAAVEARPTLTTEQEQALLHLRAPRERPVLLLGVTGSGKTEVYLRLLEDTLGRGRQALFLVPEIALTPQTIDRLKSRFGEQDLAVLHSGLSDGERYDEWHRIESGEARLVVGARSAVFAPVRDLGVIVIDEEHETTYRQEDSPRYDARGAARERARREGALLVMGSATPSVEAYYRAQRGDYTLLTLTKRVGERPLPPVRLIDLREQKLRGLLTEPLQEAMAERLGRREQVILLLNRRGFAPVLVCRSCGTSVTCPHCDVSLTLHQSPLLLRCHYCGFETAPPRRCTCGSERLRPLGAGTQRLEEEVRERFPAARVLRMDQDTTGRRGSHEVIYRSFAAGEADILIGTQMVAKGLHFPRVTLVGVVLADSALRLPDFRAGERTFQLLTQVAGRAGRGDLGGEVLIQTFAPDHYALAAVVRGDLEGFYAQELDQRRPLGYPPFGRLLLLLFQGPKEEAVIQTANQWAQYLADRAELLGPAPALLKRIRDQYRWQILLKDPSGSRLREAVQAAMAELPPPPREVSLQATVDPLSIY